jgi:hypothetical protein
MKQNQRIAIGNCELTTDCLIVSVQGWFGAKRHEVPWPRVHTNVVNGELVITDSASSRVRVAMSMRTTYNAVTIGLIAASRGKQQ